MAKTSNGSNNQNKSTKIKKKKFLEAFKEGVGIVKRACQKVNIARKTYYAWRKKDEEFKQKADEIEKNRVHEVEDGLYEKIEKGSMSGIKYYLSRKGGEDWKKTEKREVEHSGELTEKVQKPMDDKDQQVSKEIANEIIDYLEKKSQGSSED